MQTLITIHLSCFEIHIMMSQAITDYPYYNRGDPDDRDRFADTNNYKRKLIHPKK